MSWISKLYTKYSILLVVLVTRYKLVVLRSILALLELDFREDKTYLLSRGGKRPSLNSILSLINFTAILI